VTRRLLVSWPCAAAFWLAMGIGTAQADVETPGAPGPAAPEVAPEAYAVLLKTYVTEEPAGDAGIETRFDYAKFLAADGQARTRADLRARFLTGDPAGLSDDARMAWAVNAYNFLVIDTVLDALAKDPGLASIADIGGKGSYKAFDEPRFKINGEDWTLNRLEHEYLFLGVDRKSGTLPPGLDPRLHFAVVCAAKGCPPLWPEPYVADGLDKRLTEVTENALASHHHLRIEEHRVHVGQIFSWYAVDFGGKIPAFLASYHMGAAKVLHDGADVTPDIDWDWSLNAPEPTR